MARGTNTNTTITTLALPTIVGALVVSTAGEAHSATPTYYNNLGAFQADVTSTVTDNYQNPLYVFNQSDAVMSGVLGETDYMTTGHLNLNLVVAGGRYCAGCNGSFLLSFQTTSVGNAIGVNGAGFDVMSSDNSYYAYITFGDGTTANIQLPPAGTFWGVAAPERIQSIHVGLSNGGTTTGGYIEIDNLIVGDGNIGGCVVPGDCVDDGNPCTDAACVGGFCQYVPNVAPCDDGNPCTDEVCAAGTCVPSFNTASCDDDEVCTENDVCALGICQGSLVSCEDGNPCTTNFCAFGVGCDMLNNANPCDDGNVCTEADACSMGSCAGDAVNCDDDDPCTADACDPVMGCVSEPVAGCCDSDDDCADGVSCDLETNTCSDATGSTGGDSGMPGSTGTPGETGLDGTGGGSGVDSESGGLDAGAVGSSGGAEDTSAGFDPNETPDFSGCGCRSDGPPATGRWLWLVAGLGAIARRRRRKAA